MQALWVLFGFEGLGLFVVAFVSYRVGARLELELERHRNAIRRLWRDRDELRAEVNRLRQHVAAKLAEAGLTPAVVQISDVRPLDVEPCTRCGEPEGERVGTVCRECHRALEEVGSSGTH